MYIESTNIRLEGGGAHIHIFIDQCQPRHRLDDSMTQTDKMKP